jgi:hypothetical protein
MAHIFFERRSVLLGMASLAAFPGRALASQEICCGVDYLEALGKPGTLKGTAKYLPPSQLHDAYDYAIYVNAAAKGPAAQKMWVLNRVGRKWKLALWDQDYWAQKDVTAQPSYSWPVSTGRKYSDSPSGPTPLGVFNSDDRRARHRVGWGSPGMYNSIYIDLHYSGGRASGVAIHGTTKSKYSRLGTIDSHGCVRMTQRNADEVWRLFHPDNSPGPQSPIWGEVPRYFKSSPRPDLSARRGYVRDGTLLRDKDNKLLTKPGYRAVFVFFRDDI